MTTWVIEHDYAAGRTDAREATPDDARRLRLQLQHGPDALVVIVYGKPTQQGSKRTAKGTTAVWEDAAADLAPWRQAIQHAIENQHPQMIPKGVGVHMESHFSLRRPDAHYRTGKHAGQLKDSYRDAAHTTYPDGDKLKRAVMDAAKWGGAYQDDKQVTRGVFEKHYATPGSGDPWILDRPGAVIVIRAAS